MYLCKQPSQSTRIFEKAADCSISQETINQLQPTADQESSTI
jgi:murein L,D-transpeptidase YafK